MSNLKSLPRNETADSVPTGDQTTLRVRKRLQEQLKIISALDSKTIFAITDSVLTDYVRRYESAIGRPLIVGSKANTPEA